MQDNKDIDFENQDVNQENENTYKYDVTSTDEHHTRYVTPDGGTGYSFTPQQDTQKNRASVVRPSSQPLPYHCFWRLWLWRLFLQAV